MKNVGGQAVIEGVMMKTDSKMAIAIRLPNKKIKTKIQKIKKLKKLWRLPIIRGFMQLILMLIFGIKALNWSADQQMEEHEKIGLLGIILTLVLSFGFVILFFIIAPFFLTKLIIAKGVLFNIIDGILRIAIFIIYLVIISRIGDVKTLYKYHGAEHKTIHCHEAKKALTVKNIKKFSTLHPRCGTAFILIVLIISILVFSLIRGSWQIRLFSRIILIPVITGISYEILKLSNKFKDSLFTKIITAPGLMLQKLTTKEPTNKQIEVAVKALKALK
ncbi:DUF1385 domain-containing protein [Candidatus Woesearchaeota archaeon]|nr:DUF1385 domain-containing protein [Candidatus Woesearchaeota archaeon]